MTADLDRGEQPGLMEPLLISEGSRHRSHLTDLAFELAGKAAGLRRSLPAGIHDALADLVRAMNCYYSNLIEGHDTHPVDIERALRNDYSADPHQRTLQLEATAHIAVQQWIDADGLAGTPASTEAICAIHRRFGELLPEELLRVTNPETGEVAQMVPGQIRHQDVRVGRHIAVSPGALPRFLERFEDVYGRLGCSEVVLGAAAAHHRLLWIHPFLDGNGRVSRLVSHAMLRQALDTGGIWSVARGLARNSAGYKAHLANCDLPRRNDLDGRGSLSEEALGRLHRVLPRTLPGSGRLHGRPGAARPAAWPDPVLGWRGGPTGVGCRPRRARSWKRCSIAAACHAATSLPCSG